MGKIPEIERVHRTSLPYPFRLLPDIRHSLLPESLQVRLEIRARQVHVCKENHRIAALVLLLKMEVVALRSAVLLES